MRLLVTSRPQNASFRGMRFSSPAQTPTHLTQKRTLAPAPHAKAHSVSGTSRKTALWPWVLTQKRTLTPAPHAKAHSDRGPSRKTAFCPRNLTQKRILTPAPHGKAHSACVPSPKDALCIPATATKNRCNPGSAQRDPSAARPGKTWRGERPSSCGGATDPPSPPPTSTPSVPLPVPRKHQVLRLGLGCIKRTFPFGERWETRPPVNLPCSTLRHAVAKRARGAAAWGRREGRVRRVGVCAVTSRIGAVIL